MNLLLTSTCYARYHFEFVSHGSVAIPKVHRYPLRQQPLLAPLVLTQLVVLGPRLVHTLNHATDAFSGTVFCLCSFEVQGPSSRSSWKGQLSKLEGKAGLVRRRYATLAERSGPG